MHDVILMIIREHLCVCVADIQHCLLSAGDVGCGMFECFSNNTCEIGGLHDICLTFMHNAGKFDSQVNAFLSVRCLSIFLDR